MAMYKLEHVQLFWERSLNTKVVVAWSRHMLVLTFRGTASIRNAVADLQVCVLLDWFCGFLLVYFRLIMLNKSVTACLKCHAGRQSFVVLRHG